MKLNVKLLSFCFLIFISIPHVYAQDSDLQDWSLFTLTTPIDSAKKYSLYLEAQPRVGDNVSRMERLLLRTAVGYNLDKNISFWLGYAWTPLFINNQYQSDFKDENRIFQQLLIKDDSFGLAWQHRLRYEQRYISGASSVSNRFRYLLRASMPWKTGAQYGLTSYDEIFITLNSLEKGPKSGFDRNRIFIGPYLQDGIVRYEFGYLFEYARKFRDEGRAINAVLFSVGINF